MSPPVRPRSDGATHPRTQTPAGESPTLDPPAIRVAEGDGNGVSATIVGDPSNVDLGLWGRAPDGAIEVFGTASAVRLLQEWLVLATP
jgi:hypothetical protein